MKDQLATELDVTAKELLAVLSSFDKEEFNHIPAEDVWSAAQMSDHVLQSVSGFGEMLLAQGKPADRPADEKVEELKNIFLDFSTSLKSPEFILPRGRYFEQAQIIESLKNEYEKAITAASTVDLNEMGPMNFPQMGALSKIEMVYFITVHTKRHIHQAQKIKAAA